MDLGPVYGATATALFGAAVWAARQFVRSESVHIPLRARAVRDSSVRDVVSLRALLTADMEAALARHENSMLERFNGRYPSKEVFQTGMDSVREQLAETRKYIGDAKRELSVKIDQRVDRLEDRVHELEREP